MDFLEWFYYEEVYEGKIDATTGGREGKLQKRSRRGLLDIMLNIGSLLHK